MVVGIAGSVAVDVGLRDHMVGGIVGLRADEATRVTCLGHLAVAIITMEVTLPSGP